MFKKTGLLICFVSLVFAGFAQNQDSLNVVKAKWSKHRIAPKVTLYQYHFDAKNLFGSNENISFVEVKNTGRRALLGIAAEEKRLLTTSAFGLKDSAIVALNGNFFDVKNGGSVDFVRVKGNVINENRLEKTGKRARHQQAAISIKKGKLSILKWDGTADWEKGLLAEDILLNGPLLFFDGLREPTDTSAFSRLRHPRTCVGLKANGHVILLTVDGRSDQSAGMSLFELTQLMTWLGCTSALNFDGGGSTTLWVKDFPDGGVINYPSDNKQWDHEGQRKVANVLLVKKK